ncbi:MAG: sensor histidine kinase [Halioglobus sp.]
MKAIVATFFVLFAPRALALVEDYVPNATDYIFYTAALSGVVFASLVILAHKEYKWLAYSTFSLLLIISSAGMDGSLAYLIGDSDFVLWVVPFLLNAGVASFGFFVIAIRLEPPHALARFRPVFMSLAVISALLALSSYFWLKKISLVLMWIPVNVLFFTMIVGQILPPLTWEATNKRLAQLIQLFPVVVALFALGGFWLVQSSPDANQNDATILNRFTFLLYSFFSLSIVIGQVFTNTRAKEAAQRDVLEAARKEAEMKLALMRADQDYEQAVSAAAKHQMQLATVTHDLKQPISALKVAVDQLQRAESGERADRLAKAVDYIDSLSKSYLNTQPSEELIAPGSEKEAVSAVTFTCALRQMFTDEALENDIRLSFAPSRLWVYVEPLSTMRIMTNLIANAIAHASPRRILVGFRSRAGKVVFQVHDDGCGISEDILAGLLGPGVKSDLSKGQGLGLNIVDELCKAQGLEFSMQSSPGRGTSAYVEMAAARPPPGTIRSGTGSV